MKRKGTFLWFYLMLIASVAVAQPGIDELRQAGNAFNRWYFDFSDLVLVTGAITGLLGGLRVFAMWQTGKHHIDAQITGWLLGCIFLSLVGGVLKIVFGI
jgi:hypothetical protein